MGLLDDYSGPPGLGMAPRPSRAHQIVLDNLYFNLRSVLPESKYLVLTEDAIYKRGKKDRAPDIVVYEKTGSDPEKDLAALMFIEINDHKNLKALEKKIDEVMSYVATVQEAFIYRYDTGAWKKYSKLPKPSARQSYSDALSLQLSGMT